MSRLKNKIDASLGKSKFFTDELKEIQDCSEFAVGCTDKDSLLSNERLTVALKMFDKDGDGMITKKEMKKLF